MCSTSYLKCNFIMIPGKALHFLLFTPVCFGGGGEDRVGGEVAKDGEFATGQGDALGLTDSNLESKFVSCGHTHIKQS